MVRRNETPAQRFVRWVREECPPASPCPGYLDGASVRVECARCNRAGVA